MTEMNTQNQTEEKILPEEVSGIRNTDSEYISGLIKAELAKQPAKNNHPFLITGLSALLGLAAGYGGGTLANTADKEPVSQSVTQSDQAVISSAVTGNDSGNGMLSIKDIAKIASPSVVEINVTVTQESQYNPFFGGQGQSFTSTAAGSGVILSKDGYIVTNNHVTEGGQTFSVTTSTGETYEAALVGGDAKSDIAVLKVDAPDLQPASIGDSSSLSVGDTAVVIGNPLGTLGGTVTNGIISATNRSVTINNEAMNLIQTNAAINSGNSGGGLFDGQGKLIGIVNAKDSGTTSTGATIEGLGFAIPVNEAMDVVNQLIEYGYVTDRATIGVLLQTLNQDYGNYKAGLYISEIQAGSGAEKAGLKMGDRIISIDGQDAETYQQLSVYLKTKEVGDTVQLTVIRDGEELSFNVTLTAPIK